MVPPVGRIAKCIPPWLPMEMLSEVDLSELAFEQPGLPEVCSRLGAQLGANVAAYGHNAKGLPRGLCAYYRAMVLEAAQLIELTRAEARFPQVVFVAYRKPLERHPQSSGA